MPPPHPTTLASPQMWRRVRVAEAPLKKKTENVSASTLTFIFWWWGVKKKKKNRSGETWRQRLILAKTQTAPPSGPLPSVSPRLPHFADLSPELQYEINVGPAGNERSPQEIEEEGAQKKNSARSRRTDFWHVDVQCGRLLSTLSGLTHLHVAAATQRARKVFGLLASFFFPGTAVRRRCQESGRAERGCFSGALFVLFRTQRQHDLK